MLERNLNPKTACLKRREEEKSEESVHAKYMTNQSMGNIPNVSPSMIIGGSAGPTSGPVASSNPTLHISQQQLSGQGPSVPHLMSTGPSMSVVTSSNMM